jgi:protease-4
MSEKKPGVIRRFFCGIWNALNFTRRLVFNLAFLLLLLVFVAALFGGGHSLQSQTALVIAPQGELVEQFSADPASRAFGRMLGEEAPETQFRDVLKAIERAAKDQRIDRIVLRTDHMSGAGLAQLREIGAALRKFRESGKQVVAYGDYYEQKQYYLAAAADEVYLHPEGALLLEGLSAYRSYYRELPAGQARRGRASVPGRRVQVRRRTLHPRCRLAPRRARPTLFWLGDLWQRFVADVALAQARSSHEPEDLNAPGPRCVPAWNRAMAIWPRWRSIRAWSTSCKHLRRDPPDADRQGRRADEENHTFRQVSMDDYLGFLARETMPIDTRPQVAVVVAQGEITDGEQPPGTVGGVSTAELVRRRARTRTSRRWCCASTHPVAVCSHRNRSGAKWN